MLQSEAILLSLGSGALGSLLVLICQAVSRSYESQKNDIIGTVVLTYQVQATVNSMLAFEANYVDRIFNKLVEHKNSDATLSQFLAFYIPRSVEGILAPRLDMNDRNILKYKSLGCFYVVSHINRQAQQLEQSVAQLIEKKKMYESGYSVEEAKILNEAYCDAVHKITLQMLTQLEIMLQNLNKLTEWTLMAFNRRVIINVIYRKDIRRLKGILNSTTLFAASLKEKLSKYSAKNDEYKRPL